MVTVWIHQVDTARFPDVPEGWRWCVAMGDDPSDTRTWCNAGWAPTATEAEVEGEQNAATSLNALALTGVPTTRRTVRLEHDPCPVDSMNEPMPGSTRRP